MSSSRLIELNYFGPKSEVRLTAYADTIIMEPDEKKSTITAIRFGGYPEVVRAMADAPSRRSTGTKCGFSTASPRATGGSSAMTAYTPPPR